jgi:hypothetical protein
VKVKAQGRWIEAWRPPDRVWRLNDSVKWIAEGAKDGDVG